MSATNFPVRLVRGVPVVAAPIRIQAGYAHLLWAAVASWIAHGHATFVVDLSRTRTCDRAGLHVLAGVHNRVRAEGGGLRLAHCRAGMLPGAGLGPSAKLFASVVEAVSELPAVVIEPAAGPSLLAAMPG
jgi:anti-anti-sigma regulatory factor